MFDFGGVLTTSFTDAMRAFAAAEGVPEEVVFTILFEAYRDATIEHPLARLEVGKATIEEFERELAEILKAKGHPLSPERLHARMLKELRPVPEMWALVRDVRAAGARTALVPNSWGEMGSPHDELDAHFDAVVLSGQVGLRKPDAAIFELAADRLGLPMGACAFVDDVQWNVDAAEALGMVGIHHVDVATTAEALRRFVAAGRPAD